ncbi:MAG TPA: hypothetical protein VNL77_09950 [Roseiflexaceae bacterium]|nr:hypothetical protein [Roseiflexaceae bacterium]
MQSEANHYTIRVQGQIGAGWSDWFDGLTVTAGEGGETILSGVLPDQAALHGVLARLHTLNLPLLAVLCNEPDPNRERGA